MSWLDGRTSSSRRSPMSPPQVSWPSSIARWRSQGRRRKTRGDKSGAARGSRGDVELAEVRNGPAIDPQRDAAFRIRAGLHVVHDERRLLLTVDEQPRVIATHLDADLRPDVRLHIDVRLVLRRCLLPQTEPRPVRV